METKNEERAKPEGKKAKYIRYVGGTIAVGFLLLIIVAAAANKCSGS